MHFFREIDFIVIFVISKSNQYIELHTMDKILNFGAMLGAILILTFGILPYIAFSIFIIICDGLFSNIVTKKSQKNQIPKHEDEINDETGQSEMKIHQKLKKTVQFNDEIDMRNFTLPEEEQPMIENDAPMKKKIIRKHKNPPGEEFVDDFDDANVELEMDLKYLYPVFQKNLPPKPNDSYDEEDSADLLDTTENLAKLDGSD